MDMYFIHRAMDDFDDKHPFLFMAFKIFMGMLCVVLGFFFLAAPAALAIEFSEVWILSAFIIYPFGFSFIAWIVSAIDR